MGGIRRHSTGPFIRSVYKCAVITKMHCHPERSLAVFWPNEVEGSAVAFVLAPFFRSSRRRDQCFVTGHDFSRVEKASKMCGALAPRNIFLRSSSARPIHQTLPS